jgi:hypothetical protein
MPATPPLRVDSLLAPGAPLIALSLALCLAPAARAQEVAGRLLVHLDAGDASAKTETWTNLGELGDFERRGGPQVMTRDGRPAVAFGGQGAFEGPTTVADMEGASPRTIEVWAWNPDLAGEETLVAWGRRGGADGANMALGFGKHEGHGAAVHGKRDLSWGQLPDAKSWCHLVYTYDGERARVFYNGSVMTVRDVVIDTAPDQPIRIGAQGAAEGALAAYATLSIGRVRVHAGALTPGQVMANFQREAPEFGVRPWTELRKVRLEDPQLAERINAAIDRGAAALIAQQEIDGSWRERVDGYGSGMTALALYALLKSGVPADHPAIKRGFAFVAQNPPTRTYSAGCALMAIGALPEGHHTDLMQDLVDRLLDWQVGGGWAYPGGHDDLSNTQYAVLGLRAAATRGAKIPSNAWASAATYTLRYQERRRKQTGSGFSYHGGKTPTGSMTAAGIAVLAVASQESKRAPKPWATAIERGLIWLGEHFSVTDNPYPASAAGHENSWLHYYRYGLERVGSLLNIDEIGGRNWYLEGAVALLQTQKPEGTWGGQSDTCFGLLFLTRATAKKPSTGRTVEAGAVSGRYGADDPEAPLSLRASGHGKLAVWISSFGAKPLEEHSWEGEKGKLRVVRVEYFRLEADEKRVLLEARDGDGERASDDPRFAIQTTFAPGKHRVVARAIVLNPNGEDVELESEVLEIEVDRAREPELVTYAERSGENLLLNAEIDATASSSRGGHGPARIADGLSATAWGPKKDDTERRLRLKLNRPVRADTVVLTPWLPNGRKAADAPNVVRRIELVLNGKPREVTLNPSAWRKTVVPLGKVVAVRTLEIRLIETTPGHEPAMAEVELRKADTKRVKRGG